VLRVGDAASMAPLDDDSVPLVVTSPPYPMVEQRDDLFAGDDVAAALDAGDRPGTEPWRYRLSHTPLEPSDG
jgi:DNA modification methylase